MDGVNSMTGNAPDLRAFARVAREHGALLYVDDAHGFGVIGERGPGERCPYGMRGNSIVRHYGESYESLILVGGFSKAYSSLLAFIACPTEVKELLKVAAPPYLYSGPSPVASLATTLAGFDVNERRGEQLREVVYRHTRRVLECLARLEVATPNRSGLPIVEIPLRDHARIDAVGQLLFDRGVYVTLAAYPLVPRDEVGFRVQLTAANTDAEVDTLIAVLEELAAHGRAAARASRTSAPPHRAPSARPARTARDGTRAHAARDAARRDRPLPRSVLHAGLQPAAGQLGARTPALGHVLAGDPAVRPRRTGSFLAAGLAVGAFSLAGALVGPLLGALVDRVGQTRVLLARRARPGGAAGCAGAGRAGGRAGGGDRRAGGAGGRRTAADRGLRTRAVVARSPATAEELRRRTRSDATTQETIWTLGPLLVGSTAGLVSPAAAVLACAAITVVGTGILRRAPPLSRGWRAHGARALASGARWRQPRPARAARHGLLAGVVIGAVEVGLPALAVAAGRALVGGPAAGAVQRRQHGRRAAVLRRELGTGDRAALHGAAAGDGGRAWRR